MKRLSGEFLVASRHLRDPNFYRTVVLMVQHQEEGALGLVLNRPGDKRISDVWDKTGHAPCDNPQNIFIGGPVPGPLMAVHRCEELAEQTVLPGIFVTTGSEALDQLVRQEEIFRLFAGHSGWGSGQLESELEMGGWLTSPADADDVFSDPESLWKTVTNRIGLKIIAPQLDPKRMPSDPRLN